MTVHRLGQARVVQSFKGLTNTVVESVWSDGKLVSHCELVHDHARMCGMEVTVFPVFIFCPIHLFSLPGLGMRD